MKKSFFLILAAGVLCAMLASCGMNEGDKTTTSTRPTESVTSTTSDGMFNGTPEDEMNTVSEWFSEGASELRDSSFLDPENGIVSDTNTMQ